MNAGELLGTACHNQEFYHDSVLCCVEVPKPKPEEKASEAATALCTGLLIPMLQQLPSRNHRVCHAVCACVPGLLKCTGPVGGDNEMQEASRRKKQRFVVHLLHLQHSFKHAQRLEYMVHHMA